MSDTETTAVQALTVKAKTRKPLVVRYGPEGEEVEYTLPGRIPPEILTIQAQAKKPKNPAKNVQEEWQNEVAVALIDKFYELVVPADFKAELDLENLAEVFGLWSGHVGLGEFKGSGN